LRNISAHRGADCQSAGNAPFLAGWQPAPRPSAAKNQADATSRCIYGEARFLFRPPLPGGCPAASRCRGSRARCGRRRAPTADRGDPAADRGNGRAEPGRGMKPDSSPPRSFEGHDEDCCSRRRCGPRMGVGGEHLHQRVPHHDADVFQRPGQEHHRPARAHSQGDSPKNDRRRAGSRRAGPEHGAARAANRAANGPAAPPCKSRRRRRPACRKPTVVADVVPAAVQDVFGEDREQVIYAAEEHGEQVERDRGQDSASGSRRSARRPRGCSRKASPRSGAACSSLRGGMAATATTATKAAEHHPGQHGGHAPQAKHRAPTTGPTTRATWNTLLFQATALLKISRRDDLAAAGRARRPAQRLGKCRSCPAEDRSSRRGRRASRSTSAPREIRRRGRQRGSASNRAAVPAGRPVGRRAIDSAYHRQALHQAQPPQGQQGLLRPMEDVDAHRHGSICRAEGHQEPTGRVELVAAIPPRSVGVLVARGGNSAASASILVALKAAWRRGERGRDLLPLDWRRIIARNSIVARTTKITLAALALLVGGSLAAWCVWHRATAAGAGLRASGNIETTEVHVGFKIPGRVVRRPRRRGRQGQEGRTDRRAWRRTTSKRRSPRGRASLGVAQAARDELLAGSRAAGNRRRRRRRSRRRPPS